MLGEKERFYLTNVIAFEIFLVVAILYLSSSLPKIAGLNIAATWIIGATIGILSLLIMSAIKPEGLLITGFFWFTIAIMLLGTIITLWGVVSVLGY